MNAADIAALAEAIRAGGARREIQVKELSSTDPGDWKVWRTDFLIKTRLNGWDDARQRMIIHMSMAGAARTAMGPFPTGYLTTYQEDPSLPVRRPTYC